jgi:hypothetical protein
MYTLKTKNKIQVKWEGIKIKRKKGSKEWKDQANKKSLRKATKKPKEELCFINDKENKKSNVQKLKKSCIVKIIKRKKEKLHKNGLSII